MITRRADLDEPVLGRHDRAEQDARVRAESHVTGQHAIRRDIGGRVDRRHLPSMLDEQGP